MRRCATSQRWPALQGPHNAAECRRGDRRLRALRHDRGADRTRASHLSRPAAPDGAGRREGRRAVRQRQQGDQPDLDGAGAGRLPGKSTGSSAAWPRATISAPARRSSAMSAPPTRSARRADVRAPLVAAHGRWQSARCWTRRSRRAAARRRRARSCCSRRPAPRSTSSGIMRRGAMRSAPRWRRL